MFKILFNKQFECQQKVKPCVRMFGNEMFSCWLVGLLQFTIRSCWRSNNLRACLEREREIEREERDSLLAFSLFGVFLLGFKQSEDLCTKVRI